LSQQGKLVAMPQRSTTYSILIASPSDTMMERDVVSECVKEWNSAHHDSGLQCRDIRWELDAAPAFGERTQEVLNDQLVDSADILIGVFNSRIGSPTGVATSGTLEEINRFVAVGKPVMLYFSTAPVPREHDANQLQLLRDYQREISNRAIYKTFADLHELRRKVSRDLAATMAKLAKAENPLPPPPQKSELARLFIQTRPGQRSGDVKTVTVYAVIQNLSPVRKVSDYVCTVSVPKACLTHSSTMYLAEVRENVPPDRRVFRRSSLDPGVVKMIWQGEKAQIFSIDLGVDQLLMKGTWLEGNYEGTLADKVTVDAVVEGELLHAERTIKEIFENPTYG
jgi:hypothetical protein